MRSSTVVGARRGASDRAEELELVESVPGVVDVLRMLGRGQFGIVWECEVDGYKQSVAVKVFSPAHCKQQTRECRLHAKLQHPNLVGH